MNLARVAIRVPLPGRTIASAIDEHLVAASDETPWLPVADVITCTGRSREAGARVRALLARYPGCLVVAGYDAAGRCVVGTRDGQIGTFVGDPRTLGSVVHAWILAGLRLDDLDGVPSDAVITRTDPAKPAVLGRVRPVAHRDR